MTTKRKRTRPPTMLLWDRNMQRRFVDAVERLVVLSHDLEVLRSNIRIELDALLNRKTRAKKGGGE
jgi:hypothetical protein